MILQSHNSWSYLKPRKWYLRPIAFMAKCQNVSIFDQYNKYGVKSFDLRVRFDKNGKLIIAHGKFEYDITHFELMEHLSFLNANKCVVRVIHEARNEKQYTEKNVKLFREFCEELKKKFPKIVFYHGKNLYNWQVDYEFDYKPTEEGVYSSVCEPKIIDDWYPWLFAKFNNKKTLEKGTDKDILSIDFVNIR